MGSPTQKNHHVELKQGFCELADPPVEDANLFENVLQTAVAMANYSQDSEGLILIGVADKESAATRVKELFGVDPIVVAGQLVVGTEEQITHLGFDVDKWWRRVAKSHSHRSGLTGVRQRIGTEL